MFTRLEKRPVFSCVLLLLECDKLQLNIILYRCLAFFFVLQCEVNASCSQLSFHEIDNIPLEQYVAFQRLLEPPV